MTLLRASSSAIDEQADAAHPGVGVEHGEALVAFAKAAVLGDALETDREAVRALVGDDGLAEAAATVSAFEGLNRVADATGIELDDALNVASADLREAMHLERFAGAANTNRNPGDGVADESAGVMGIFGGRSEGETEALG